MKIAYVKTLLEQCWQEGCNVNSQCAKDENNLTTGFFEVQVHYIQLQYNNKE